jgi:hypothetical protein
MKSILLITLSSIAVIASVVFGSIELTKERSTSIYQFEWTGKKWKVSDPVILGKTIKSPYGFLHGYVTVGRSYTLVIPHSWIGDKEARVHFWADPKDKE